MNVRWNRLRFGPALAVAALALLAACGDGGGVTDPIDPPPADTSSGRFPRAVGYLSYYSSRPISEIDGEKLTHLIYAFGRVNTASATAGLMDPARDLAKFEELRALKQRHPHLKLLVAFGGWEIGTTPILAPVAASPTGRATFAASAIQVFLRGYGGLFDGIDIDWEYPRAAEKEHYTAFIAELRKQLNEESARTGRRYLLTSATPAASSTLTNGYDLPAVHPLLDWFNVMTYDFHTGDPSRTVNFNAPLFAPVGDPTPGFTGNYTVTVYTQRGVPREKVVLGVPFYGRTFVGVPNVNNGLYQKATGVQVGEWKQDGAISYRLLKLRGFLAGEGFTRHWQNEAKVPFLFNPTTGVWITYDDEQSVRAKGEFARQNGLGGVMVWELAQDAADNSLLNALVAGLRGTT